MPRVRLIAPVFGAAFVGVVIAVALIGSPAARALPPAGNDSLFLSGTAHITSRLGVETVPLNGTASIARAAPHTDGGVEVSDVNLTDLELNGTSMTGGLQVTESAIIDSHGELRSQQAGQEYPATLALDIYMNVGVPANPSGPLALHNQVALHFESTDDITEWPPENVTLQLDSPYNRDDDGDGAVDEDSSDDDGDGLYDEDRPGPDPETPGSGFECPAATGGPDCDGVEGEDPPAELCPTAQDGMPTLCDDDSDGEIDEDAGCLPLLNLGGTTLKAGVCIREVTLEIVDPSSVTPIPSPTIHVTSTPRPPTPTRTPTNTRTPTMSPTSVSTPTATPGVTGDANCDHTVNAIDSALILQLVAGLIAGVDCSSTADANGDGTVNAIDSALILQYVAGLLPQLPP